MTHPIPHGYKPSPLGPIPQDWGVLELGEIASFSKGKGLPKEDLKKSGKYKCIHYGELFRLYGAEIIGINFYTDYDEKPVFSEENDVVMPTSDITPNGLATGSYISEKGILLGGDILIVRPESNKLFGLYLANYVRYDKKQIMKLVSGSTVYHLYGSDLSKLKLPLPPLPEQQAIASILSTCDESIATAQTLIDHLQRRHKALCQQLLTGKKRLQGFGSKWEMVKISDIAKEISKKNKNDDEMIVLSCTKYKGLVPSLEYFGKKIYSDDLTTYKIVPKNTFAYATNHIEEGSIGYQDKYDQALISPMYTIFQTNDTVNDEFLFKVLKSYHYIHEYQKRMEGSIDRRGGLRRDEFAKIKIPYPSPEEQTAIASILNESQSQIDLATAKIAKLKQYKQGLMQQLLTGKTRIPSEYL